MCVCVCVCVYVCMHVCMFVYLFVFPHPHEQTFVAKNSLSVINKGHIEAVLNFQAGKLWFKMVNMCRFEYR